MNVKLLKSKMVMFGDEDFVKSITKILGTSRQTASAKLKGESQFTRDDIALISKHYHLSADEIQTIFVGEDNESERSSEVIG